MIIYCYVGQAMNLIPFRNPKLQDQELCQDSWLN